jgi:hypothetical protein
VAYFFLAPTFPVVYRAQGPTTRDEVERQELEAELEDLLEPGESLVSSTTGDISNIPAALALTTRRLILKYGDAAFAFRHAEIEWLSWSPLAAKLSFRLRATSTKFQLVIGGAHWKIDAEQLANAANSRFGISRRR